MQNTSSLSRILLFVSLALVSTPVLIAGTSILGIDSSGLMTTGLFLTVGLPAGLLASVLAVVAVVMSKKGAGVPRTVESQRTRIVKRILTVIIIIMLCTPVLYVIYFIGQLLTT